MDSQSSSSQSNSSVSASLLIPESPGSPNILDPESPSSSRLGWYQPPDYDQLTRVEPLGEVHVINENSSDSALTFETAEGGNSSSSTLVGSTPDREIVDDNSSEIRPQSAQSSLMLNSVNEESNDFIPENEVQKDIISYDGPPAKVRKLSSPKLNDDSDGETCPICLDSWSNSGEHRLVALKCGHLFGAQCVEKWLKAHTSRRCCPTCKSKATLKDIRFIYAKRLVAADTTQITELQQQVSLLQSEKSKVELELEKCRIAHRACYLQLEDLRSTLRKSQFSKEPSVRRTWRFALEKNLEICKDGGCRVVTYNCRTYELYVSQKSTTSLFPGYGIRKVNCVDYKLGQFLSLHHKPIRDITYSQPRDLLLSVGLDNCAKIVERGIPSATISCPLPLWSCSWDYLRSNELYVGCQSGFIYHHDIRNPSTYIQRMFMPGDSSPVVSLCSTEFGLLSCQLKSCYLWTSSPREWDRRALPIDGPFMSLCYDNDSHRALVSCRPGANGCERSKLTLCKLKTTIPTGEVMFDVEQTFSGSARSTLMSRASWIKAPGSSWVAAHSESDSTLYLHGVDGAKTISLPSSEPALDVCSVQLNGDSVVAALSESRLRLYKAVSTNS